MMSTAKQESSSMSMVHTNHMQVTRFACCLRKILEEYPKLCLLVLILLSVVATATPASATSCGNVVAPPCDTMGFAGNGRRYLINSTSVENSADSGSLVDADGEVLQQRIDGFFTPCDCYQACKAAAAAYQAQKAATAIGITTDFSGNENIDCLYWSFLPNTTFPSDGEASFSGLFPWGNSSCVLFSSLANVNIFQWNAFASASSNEGVTPNDVGGSLLDGHPIATFIAVTASQNQLPVQWINGSDDCAQHLVMPAALCSMVVLLTILFVTYKFTCGWRPPVSDPALRTKNGCSRAIFTELCQVKTRRSFSIRFAVLTVFVLLMNAATLLLVGFYGSSLKFRAPTGNVVTLFAFEGYADESSFPSDQVSNRGQSFLMQVASGVAFLISVIAFILVAIAVKMIYEPSLLWEITPSRRNLGPSLPPYIWRQKYEFAWKAMRIVEVAIALFACTLLLNVVGRYLVLKFVAQRLNNIIALMDADISETSPYEAYFSYIWVLVAALLELGWLLRHFAHQVFLFIPVNDVPSPVTLSETGRTEIPAVLKRFMDWVFQVYDQAFRRDHVPIDDQEMM